MTAQKGSAFLLKIGDGAQPPVYQTVAGLRTTQLSINGDSVVITHKESGGWRELALRGRHPLGFGERCWYLSGQRRRNGHPRPCPGGHARRI